MSLSNPCGACKLYNKRTGNEPLEIDDEECVPGDASKQYRDDPRMYPQLVSECYTTDSPARRCGE